MNNRNIHIFKENYKQRWFILIISQQNKMHAVKTFNNIRLIKQPFFKVQIF